MQGKGKPACTTWQRSHRRRNRHEDDSSPKKKEVEVPKRERPGGELAQGSVQERDAVHPRIGLQKEEKKRESQLLKPV